MAGVELPDGGYGHSGDLVGAVGLERDELDGRGELARPGAEVADYIFVVAGTDLHTAGIAAEGAAYRKWQSAVDKGIDRLLGFERVPASGEQRIANLGA